MIQPKKARSQKPRAFIIRLEQVSVCAGTNQH
jgi:hypothetical protein